MECIRDDTVIHIRSSLKSPERKNAWKEITSALGIDIVSVRTRYNTVRTSFMKQIRSK